MIIGKGKTESQILEIVLGMTAGNGLYLLKKKFKAPRSGWAVM